MANFCCICGFNAFAKDKNTGKYYCSSHQSYRTDLDRRSIQQKALAKHKANPNKYRTSRVIGGAKLFIEPEKKAVFTENSASKQFEELEMFFAEAAKIIADNPYCQECGERISKIDYRNSSAHVLPKKPEHGFPSIAAEIANLLILGNRCGCHQRYDHSWDRACKMKIWPIAVEKIIYLYPLIAKEELGRLNKIVLSFLPKKLISHG